MATNAEDAELLNGARIGDGLALGRLTERLHPWLKGFVASKVNGGSSFSIEDIVQETIFKAHYHFESFLGNSPGEFKAWLKAIAYNHIRDLGRQPAVSQGEYLSELPRGSTSPSGKVRKKEENEILLFHLERLRSPQQEIVRLRYFEQLKFQEIADRLKLTLHVVTGQYRRAMERLGDAVRNTLSDGTSHA